MLAPCGWGGVALGSGETLGAHEVKPRRQFVKLLGLGSADVFASENVGDIAQA